jgi:hypothetical protein
MSAATITLAESVVLAHALAAHVAVEIGAQYLVFKGPVAIMQGFRENKTSSDADILIDPARLDDYLAAMARRGWRPRREAVAPRYFPVHSVSLFHQRWASDIDVHFRYPGFFASDTEVFELLVSDCETRIIGGREIRAASPRAGGLILAVHALRDPLRPQSVRDLAAVERVFTRRFEDESERTATILLATQLRARHTLAPLFDRLSVPPAAGDLSPDEARAWQLVVAGTGSTAFHWWVAFHDASLGERVKLAGPALHAVLASLRSHPRYGGGVSPEDGPLVRLRLAIQDVRTSRQVLRSAERPGDADERGR